MCELHTRLIVSIIIVIRVNIKAKRRKHTTVSYFKSKPAIIWPLLTSSVWRISTKWCWVHEHYCSIGSIVCAYYVVACAWFNRDPGRFALWSMYCTCCSRITSNSTELHGVWHWVLLRVSCVIASCRIINVLFQSSTQHMNNSFSCFRSKSASDVLLRCH